MEKNLEVVEITDNILITNENNDILRYQNEEIKKYVDILEEQNYFIKDGLLVTYHSQEVIKLSNFIPVITMRIENKEKNKITYKMKAVMIADGRDLEEIEVTPNKLVKGNFIIGSHWDTECLVFQNNNKLLMIATQIIAKYTMKKVYVYKNTGFEKINDSLIYLYEGGYIGKTDTEVTTNLKEYGLQQYCFTNKEFDIKEALKMSYFLKEVADEKITIPILATIYLAPLLSLFSKQGINIDYILSIVGKTGSRKSSIAAVALSHYGDFNRNTIPTNFKSTSNSLERYAWILKDTLMVADNYESRILDKEKSKVFSNLLEMYGDRAGRSRLNQKITYRANGVGLITAEFIPDIPESKLARMFVVEMKQDSIDNRKLSVLQENKDKLAFCMMKYIEWIIKNEDSIIKISKEFIKNSQIKMNEQFHGRISEAVNVINLGYYLMLEFFSEHGVIEKNTIDGLTQNAYEKILEVAVKQTEDIESNNPVNMFYTAVEELIGTNKIYFLDLKDGMPISYPSGKEIGFLDEENGYYFFYPKDIYFEVNKYFDFKFPLTKLSLEKYLESENLLFKTENNDRRTIRKRNKANGQEVPVLGVKIRNLEVAKRTDKTEIQEDYTEKITNSILNQ